MVDNIEKLIQKLEGKSYYSERNAEDLKAVFSELLRIINELATDDPNRWHGVQTGVYHTEGHITNLSNKAKKWRIEGYKYGMEQTLDDLKEIKSGLI
ncbi:hypothetical protein [Pedobacter panaciterrae]